MKELETIQKELAFCKKMKNYYRDMYKRAIENDELNKLSNIEDELYIWQVKAEQTDYIIYLINKNYGI